MSVSDLCDLYRTYNEKYFGGALPSDVIISVIPDNGSGLHIDGHHDLGMYSVSEGKKVIEINELCLKLPCMGRIVLLHEMVHVKVGFQARHGSKKFREACRALGLDALVEVLK